MSKSNAGPRGGPCINSKSEDFGKRIRQNADTGEEGGDAVEHTGLLTLEIMQVFKLIAEAKPAAVCHGLEASLFDDAVAASK